MKNFYQFVVMIGLALLFASCASKTTVTQKKVRSGLDSYNEGYELTKDEHGMTRSSSKQISEYDSQRKSNIGGRDFSGKDYNKEKYRKERWGGNKGYTAKQYGGKTDGSKFKHSPHYVSRDVRAQANGQYATANESQFNAGRNSASGKRAHEGNSNAIQTGSSGYVTSRNNAPEPLIMSKQEYNKLSVRETKAMLGR